MFKSLKLSLSVLTLACGFGAHSAHAQATLTDFSLTTTSISFHLSAVIPTDETPAFGESLLLFRVTDYSAGYTFSSASPFSTQSITTTPTATGLAAVTSGSTQYGDYFGLIYSANLIAGQILDFTITATWNRAVFQPQNFTDISQLEITWGSEAASSIAGGVHLNSHSAPAIPEPAHAAMVTAAAGLVLTGYLRRRRRAA
jgi:hypothetical protein